MNSDEAHLHNYLRVIQMRRFVCKGCCCLLSKSDSPATFGQPWCEVYDDFVRPENAVLQDISER